MVKQSGMLILSLLTLSTSAFAAGVPAKTDGVGQRDTQTLLQFMSENLSCASATDQCVICARRQNELLCSTPAIACVIKPPTCTSAASGDEAKASGAANNAH